MSGVLAELERLFPDAHVEVLLREEDAALAERIRADAVRVVRFEERRNLVRELRRRPFDLIAMQLGRGGAHGLRSLPFVLRARTIVAFNDSLDHFPLNVFRVRDLIRHFGLASHGTGILLAPALLMYLVLSAGWIHVRGWWRRLRRRRPSAEHPVGRTTRGVARARSAAGSESV